MSFSPKLFLRFLISKVGILSCLAFLNSCSRIDHKQSALDPKGLVAQNQYDIFMLSVWITIFLLRGRGMLAIRDLEIPGQKQRRG